MNECPMCKYYTAPGFIINAWETLPCFQCNPGNVKQLPQPNHIAETAEGQARTHEERYKGRDRAEWIRGWNDRIAGNPPNSGIFDREDYFAGYIAATEAREKLALAGDNRDEPRAKPARARKKNLKNFTH